MIFATAAGDVEVRSNWGNQDRIPRPSEGGNQWTAAGRYVSVDDALGLPAVMRGIRLLSETIACLPVMVYQGSRDQKVKAEGSWQWQLLQDGPYNDQQTPFQFWSYVTMCRIARGGAYILKGKARGQVRLLYTLDPQCVAPRVGGDGLVFDVSMTPGEKPRTLTRQDIIYIPGLLTNHPLIGVSVITAHRQSLGGSLSREEFGNRFFADDATPSLAIEFGENMTKEQRAEARESWEARHRGTAGSFKVAALPAGAKVQKISVSPADAQYIEGQKWSIEETARIVGCPAKWLGGVDPNPRATPEQNNMELLQFTLSPHLTAVAQAFHQDQDMFPDKTLRPEFWTDMLVQADMGARYAAYTQTRQAGWLSINDIRGREGLPPIEGGDDYQATPVGGAPNLQPSTQPPGDSQGENEPPGA